MLARLHRSGELTAVWVLDAERPGIRTTLSRARKVFIDWRYTSEHRGLIIEAA